MARTGAGEGGDEVDQSGVELGDLGCGGAFLGAEHRGGAGESEQWAGDVAGEDEVDPTEIDRPAAVDEVDAVQVLRGRGQQVAGGVEEAVGNIVCGLRADEREAITMVCVTGQAYAPTLLRGSTVSLTTNAVPLELLVGMLDQPGALNLAGIDVVNSGHRVRRGSGYPPLYSTLLADRPAAGRRETHLIVRLDITNSVPGLRYRHSIGAAAAAATERIINALVQEGIRASALSAGELDTALDELGARLAVAPTPPEPQREPDDIEGGAPVVSARASAGATRTLAKPAVEAGWRTINAHPGFLTSYYFSPEDITTAALHQMWALRSDDIVQTTSFWKNRFTEADGAGPVMVSALGRASAHQILICFGDPRKGWESVVFSVLGPRRRPGLGRWGRGPGSRWSARRAARTNGLDAGADPAAC